MTDLRNNILQTDDRKSEIVIVPEWNDAEILVIGMTGTERDAFEGSLIKGKGKKSTVSMDNMRAKLVVKTAYDPTTEQRIFADDDVKALGKKSAAALDKLFSTAQRLSGISDDDWEELEGN